MSKKLFILLCLCFVFGTAVFADWDESMGHKMHYAQLPDLLDTGMDVLAGPLGVPDGLPPYEKFLADDFKCSRTGPITGIHIWGSYNADIELHELMPHTAFSLVIYSDIPADQNPDGYSKPGEVLWETYMSPTAIRIEAEGLQESFYDPNPNQIIGADTVCWQFNFDIPEDEAFVQEEGTIYWLGIHYSFDMNGDGIVDNIDLAFFAQSYPGMFGWKTSGVQHFNDDAVFTDVMTFGGSPHVVPQGAAANWREMRYPLGHPMETESIDLAFVINGPEQQEPGITKYIQPPDLTPEGVDIRVDNADGVTRHIADDFPCDQTGPITDIHFWGSWKDDDKGDINSIEVRIYSDDPVGPGGTMDDNQYSMPDQLLWQDQFVAGQFVESLFYDLTPDFEWWWDPYFGDLVQNGDHQVWKYDMYIAPSLAFIQEGTATNPVVYWLEIQVNTSYSPNASGFGWKTSDIHWNDDAVFANGSNFPWISGWSELRYPEGHPYNPQSLDMAFEITTTEEEEPDEKLKFQQLPLDGLIIDQTTYFGHDEVSTVYPDYGDPGPVPVIQRYLGCYMADDFADYEHSPVIRVKWWGSYLGGELAEEQPQPVNSFIIAFESDNPGPPSHPELLLQHEEVMRDMDGVLTPGEFTETWFSPGGPPCNEPLYEYEAILVNPFPQDQNVVYWLKIVAVVDLPPDHTFFQGPASDPAIICDFLNYNYDPQFYDVTRWGWHNRDYTQFDQYASQPPAVNPGERVQGTITDLTGVDIDIWHFQDDSVTGAVQMQVDSDNPVEPKIIDILQLDWIEQYYKHFLPTCGFGVDGPPEIEEFSKDLAFELWTPTSPPCKGDFNGSGTVTSDDISLLVNYWLLNKNFFGIAPLGAPGYVWGMDLNGSGTITSDDISLVVNHWLLNKNFFGIAPCMP